MKKIIAKPHLFFFGLAIVFMLLGIFINPNKVVDINLNALYVVISYTDWCYFSTLFFCLIGLNYFSLYWANRPPKKYLTIIKPSRELHIPSLLKGIPNFGYPVNFNHPLLISNLGYSFLDRSIHFFYNPFNP
jgi:hypothetical protein